MKPARATFGVLLCLLGCGRDHLGTPTPGAIGTETPSCEGVCTHVAPIGWAGPTLVGKASTRPLCPSVAPSRGFEGFADLDAGELTCPTCACGPATCALPTTAHASAEPCPGGADATSFDAAEGWEGSCSTDHAIAPGASCGGSACESLTFDPPTIEPCAALELDAGKRVAPSWGSIVQECLITLSDACETEGSVCAPTPPDDFSLCIYQVGAVAECPSEYSTRVLVFSDARDERACSACECGSPVGGTCSAYVEVFSDDACADPVVSVTTVSDGVPKCVDLPAGVALGSKAAQLDDDAPGACAATGGEVTGTVEPIGAVTLCCRAEDVAR